jgi:hypothetical protein
VFCVGISPAGLIEADAPPASDKAPATPNAVTTLLRPLPFEVCFERDMASDLRLASALGPKVPINFPLGWFRSQHIPELSGSSTFKFPRENPLGAGGLAHPSKIRNPSETKDWRMIRHGNPVTPGTASARRSKNDRPHAGIFRPTASYLVLLHTATRPSSVDFDEISAPTSSRSGSQPAPNCARC